MGYPSGQAGQSEISVCTDVQVSPYSLATGIAEMRTQLEAAPTFTSSLRQPPIAATETAAARGLTLAPNVVDTPTRGTRRAPLCRRVLPLAFVHCRRLCFHRHMVWNSRSLFIIERAELLRRVLRRRVLGCSVRLACRRVSTFSYGAPSPLLGSDIGVEYPAARPGVFQPKSLGAAADVDRSTLLRLVSMCLRM